MPHEEEVNIPTQTTGTVEFMNTAGFNNSAPLWVKRLLTAIRYFCVGLITMVSGTDLFSGNQSKLICFILGAIVLLSGAIELGTGVKSIEEGKG